jgi:molecular chaperone HscB
MDLQFEFDSEKIQDLKLKIQQIGEDLDFQIHTLTSKFDKSDVSSSEETTSILEQIRNYYLKQKYVLRLQESLDKFAPL